MRTKIQLYAVIRLDGPVQTLEDTHRITVTKLLDVFEDAVREVERLNKLNEAKGSR